MSQRTQFESMLGFLKCLRRELQPGVLGRNRHGDELKILSQMERVNVTTPLTWGVYWLIYFAIVTTQI